MDERERNAEEPSTQGEEALEGTRPRQKQPWPGRTEGMDPQPDHGKTSYRGSRRLEGKAALVTGGDSAIGRAVALAFAREGADVAVGYLREHDDARETLRWIREAGRTGHAFATDLRDRDACRRLVANAASSLGRLDIVVNNAAYQCEVERFEDLDEAQVDRTFRTNILAYLWVAQAALEHLPQGGCILNTGSVTALEGNATLIDYSATKGAIHAFTKSLARALAERGVRVKCVAPGPVWTPLVPATLQPDHVERFGETTAWQRPAQPAELAPSYVFLASPEATWYTGEILAPSGRSTTR